MCVVSNIGDYGREQWPGPWGIPTPVQPWNPLPVQKIPYTPKPYDGPTREQFEEFLKLLRAARKFDVATGQKDCPSEEKTGWMRIAAQSVGIDPAKVDEILKGE